MIENILFLMALTYGIILTVGYIVEKKFQMPWMFTVVMFGIFLSASNLFIPVIKSDDFQLLARLGTLSLLFIIGMDLDLEKISKMGRWIAFGDLLICLVEGIAVGSLLYLWTPESVSNSFTVAFISGIAFSTIGEIILLAILNAFHLVDTKFGQLTLGLGVFDDIVDVLTIVAITLLPALATPAFTPLNNNPISYDVSTIIIVLMGLFVSTFLLIKIGQPLKSWLGTHKHLPWVPNFIILFMLFLFTAIAGRYLESLTTVAAILSGVVVRGILPEGILKKRKHLINFLGFMFLAPYFFLSLGAKISLSAILTNPLLISVIILVSVGSRVSTTTLFFRKLLGVRNAFILGIGLCANFFSTIIAQDLLLNSGYLSPTLFSAIMTAFIITKPIIIAVYSHEVANLKGALLT